MRTRQRRCPHRLRNVRFIRLRAKSNFSRKRNRRTSHGEKPIWKMCLSSPQAARTTLRRNSCSKANSTLSRSVTLIGRGYSGRRKSHDTGVRRRRHESQSLMALCWHAFQDVDLCGGNDLVASDRIRALTVDIAATGQGQLHCHSLKYSDPSARQVAKKRFLSKYFCLRHQ